MSHEESIFHDSRKQIPQDQVVMLSDGEYIKIDGITYWVEVSNDKGADK